MFRGKRSRLVCSMQGTTWASGRVGVTVLPVMLAGTGQPCTNAHLQSLQPTKMLIPTSLLRELGFSELG